MGPLDSFTASRQAQRLLAAGGAAVPDALFLRLFARRRPHWGRAPAPGALLFYAAQRRAIRPLRLFRADALKFFVLSAARGAGRELCRALGTLCPADLPGHGASFKAQFSARRGGALQRPLRRAAAAEPRRAGRGAALSARTRGAVLLRRNVLRALCRARPAGGHLGPARLPRFLRRVHSGHARRAGRAVRRLCLAQRHRARHRPAQRGAQWGGARSCPGGAGVLAVRAFVPDGAARPSAAPPAPGASRGGGVPAASCLLRAEPACLPRAAARRRARRGALAVTSAAAHRAAEAD